LEVSSRVFCLELIGHFHGWPLELSGDSREYSGVALLPIRVQVTT
jgi:hypothetical protein